MSYLKSPYKKVKKRPNTQFIILVYVAEDIMVCLPHISNHHTQDTCNQAEVEIMGNKYLLQCQLQLTSLIGTINLIWKLK